ncbi:sulfotransferase domain-containing protein [Nodosilinea sp. PGN35]|uniref:sulfotransferase domain-containing protein n=1 Tax=Nodosilinea sp. PGN35 TaxID=3020489 RepID=UPI0023B2AC55|nr:sulfotransferase domain-containing protein [Nodosilinea sp. TSF1-S3]MDF0368162.1 sulfotransferase domain-containing protein [Nodosilinea sp. TSF1-S3]
MKSLKQRLLPKISQLLNKNKPILFDDDVFLISYPKSGNTWVRFLFANLLKKDASEEVNFHNVHQYCQELESQNQKIDDLPRPRIIKSHQSYNPSFPRVIYIARDCRDVYVSYYHYVKNTIPADWSFKDFIEKYDFPYGYWNQHVSSWTGSKTRNSENFKTVFYEDLLENTFSTFSEMVTFSGLASTTTQIQQAVENSTFSAMKAIEKKHGRKFSSHDNAENFVRSGKAKQWIHYFGSEELKILETRGEFEVLSSLGYSV